MSRGIEILQRSARAGFQTSAEFCFPPVCPCCDRALPSDAVGACRTCRRKLADATLTEGPRCPRCHTLQGGGEQAFGSPVIPANPGFPTGRTRVAGSTAAVCEYCCSRRVFFDQHRSMSPMQGLWREVLHRWKYENDRRLWRLFWSLCFDSRSLEYLRGLRVDRVVWIDSGSAGRQLRNFQPCADIAFAVARALRTPGGAGPDLRKKESKQQSARSYVDRFFAVHDSLEYCSEAPAYRYLLIEDVFTTGATANEAARILKKNGAFHVFVLSLLFRDAYAG